MSDILQLGIGAARVAASHASLDPRTARQLRRWWRADVGHTVVDASAVTSWANQGSTGEALDLVAPEPPSEPESGS